MLKRIIILNVFIFLLGCTSDNEIIPTNPLPIIDNSLYFPPINNSTWETISPNSLQWNEPELQNLYDFLELKNTKGFMILKNGKIAAEKYFNGHTVNAVNPWFSAVKSLTATAIGIAQDEGHLNIDHKTSDYLGMGWSSLTSNQQNLVTIRNHLTMTTGLVNNPSDLVAWTCTLPACLSFDDEAGTDWEYHQASFTLLQDVLSQTSGQNFEQYIQTKISDKIGLNGSWSNVLFLNIYSSNTRGMARFGLLSLNKGTWNENEIVSESFFNNMTNTSQNLNKSYGYLWWLNGKESFITTSSELYQGHLIPNAPNDMFAALGAGDQKIYVIPSKNMVVVRCGESAGNSQLANSSFDNELWEKINAVID